MDTQVTPPPVEVLAKALRAVVGTGLPVDSNFADEALLGLRGVVARSIDPSDRLGRVKAFDELLHRLLVSYPDDELGESARVLFGLATGVRGRNLTERRRQAADTAGYDADHFRKRIEPKIVRQVAWQLHRDSQNYIPRGRAVPPPLESSGDTPTIVVGDLANKEASEHSELVSRLWAHVYALRAEILLVERLKIWPYDPSEPETSARRLHAALDKREQEIQAVKVTVQRYIDRYGQRIQHGEAEFNVEGLLRLAGWVESV